MYPQCHFFECQITTIIVGSFETILSLNCDQGKVVSDGIKFPVSRIIYTDICIKVHGIWGWGSHVRQCHSAS